MRRLLTAIFGERGGPVPPSAVPTAAFRTRTVVPTTPISIELKPEDVPDFDRVYVTTIMRDIKLQVSIKHSYGDTLYSRGELTQPNGHWVLFEPDRIADKIIDPVLLPEVEEAVRLILEVDRDFRRDLPDHFFDESGQKWVRA